MDKLLIATFSKAPQALKGLVALKDLERAGVITLHSTAVIAKDASGVVSIKQASERKLMGSRMGLAAGLLLGVWAGPVGLFIGAAIGWLAGLVFDLVRAQVSADFLSEASHALVPEKATLLAEITETSESSVDHNLGKLGGHVVRWRRDEFVDDQLMDELDSIYPAWN